MNDIAKAFAQVQQMSEVSVFAQSSLGVFEGLNNGIVEGLNNNVVEKPDNNLCFSSADAINNDISPAL